jgi:predicted RecA/RadA family phage recombinase
MTGRLMRILAACVLVVMLAPAAARADGDPASDTLLGANVFYPYSSPVSAALQRTLNSITRAAGRTRFPIKVALIDSPMDLGVIPSLFHQPQTYAAFLAQELSFLYRGALLVVVPSGYGVHGFSGPATAAAASLAKPAGSTSNDLARAAITAVPKLAAAAGHPIKHVPVTLSTATGDGSRTLIVVILAVAAVGAAAALIAIRRRDAKAA